jgi:hypothetical protein
MSEKCFAFVRKMIPVAKWSLGVIGIFCLFAALRGLLGGRHFLETIPMFVWATAFGGAWLIYERWMRLALGFATAASWLNYWVLFNYGDRQFAGRPALYAIVELASCGALFVFLSAWAAANDLRKRGGRASAEA